MRSRFKSKTGTLIAALLILGLQACSTQRETSFETEADAEVPLKIDAANPSNILRATYYSPDAGYFYASRHERYDAGTRKDGSVSPKDATPQDASTLDAAMPLTDGGAMLEDSGWGVVDATIETPDAGVRTSSCAPAPAPGTLYQEVNSCLDNAPLHQTQAGYFTTGQAWGDYDNDGWLDLYITYQVGSNTLYRNRGDGSFTTSALSSSVALENVASGGAIFVDYDNDGDKDLYVLNHGPNTLFRNDQGLGFTDVTVTASVGDAGRGMTASWGDYDNDGHLDLYVANWFCDTCSQPPGVEGSRDRLYHNQGDGTFTDATLLLGDQFTLGQAFVASFLDYDNDGDLDIYLANDRGSPGPFTPGSYMNRNVLWRNDGVGCAGWCFTEVAESAGADARVDGMGLAIADYDYDGDLDIYCTHDGLPVLLQNNGPGQFLEVGQTAMVTYDSQSWGTFFFDYDNDGDLDLYVAIGWDPWGLDANRLYENQGNGTFQDVSNLHRLNHLGISFGAAYADYDNDGLLDFIVGNWSSSYKLYRNLGPGTSNNRWIRYRLIGGGAVNRDAIGARVFVSLNTGRTLMQEIKSGSSLGAGNDLALHFGLGQANIVGVSVRWPDGVTETLPIPNLNQEVVHQHP